MKKKNRIKPALATLALALALVSSGDATANSASALARLLRSPTGWALLTLTPEGAAFSSRALGHGISHADDLDLLISRLSEQERVASLARFESASEKLRSASSGGRLQMQLLNRVAAEELMLREGAGEIAFVKATPAKTFVANAQRFLETAANTDVVVESAPALRFSSFRMRVYMLRGNLSMDAARGKQLETIRKLGDLKLDPDSVKNVPPGEASSVVMQPLNDLEQLVYWSTDSEVRKAALESMLRYARRNSDGYELGPMGRRAPEAIEDIYFHPDLPEELRRLAFDELSYIAQARGAPKMPEFKTGRALVDEGHPLTMRLQLTRNQERFERMLHVDFNPSVVRQESATLADYATKHGFVRVNYKPGFGVERPGSEMSNVGRQAVVRFNLHRMSRLEIEGTIIEEFQAGIRIRDRFQVVHDLNVHEGRFAEIYIKP